MFDSHSGETAGLFPNTLERRAVNNQRLFLNSAPDALESAIDGSRFALIQVQNLDLIRIPEFDHFQIGPLQHVLHRIT